MCGSGQTSRGRDLRAGTHDLGYLIEPTASALETGTEYDQRTQTILLGNPRLRPARYVSLLMLKPANLGAGGSLGSSAATLKAMCIGVSR